LNKKERRLRLALLEHVSAVRGLPVTAQRRAVLKTVLEMYNHPSAEQVYAAVAMRQQRVSRATVYRALDTLVEMRLLARLSHPGRVARFDMRLACHHHLICMRCDAVLDFEDERLDEIQGDPPDTAVQGFRLRELQVQLRGVCGVCRAGAPG